MEMNLVIVGLVFVVLGYLVGVKKFTWLLAGYNEKRVKDKNKLALLVGGTFALLGIGIAISGFAGIQQAETIMFVAIGIILLELVYVNVKMVE
ncbi:DUF3784 domain-containing protein [Solibacillus sp. FSL W7-1436]|uniref:DUF3784 domain-containing protein n=1 Tax=Solibacillus sp. FSL W7-1436 TaxID=2921705 RepID=UPI0030F774EF